mmetsp:Transcript_52148/g.135232  ORF Transcript_52148/g.135232 Transcript_52148/m.135232 type:complete len:81 (-) Transcript_52148:29-271(-)
MHGKAANKDNGMHHSTQISIIMHDTAVNKDTAMAWEPGRQCTALPVSAKIMEMKRACEGVGELSTFAQCFCVLFVPLSWT